MDSARALVARGRGIALVSHTMGVSRAQLSLRVNRSADWQDRRSNRRNDEADAEILSDILDIISDMPSMVIDASGASCARNVAQRDNHQWTPNGFTG